MPPLFPILYAGMVVAEIGSDDPAWLTAVRDSLAAWATRTAACDVQYSLETVYTPAMRPSPQIPWPDEAVCVKETARAARSGNQRYYASWGQGLADGKVIPTRWETAFDGRQTFYRPTPNRVFLRRGRDEARGRPTPTAIVGLDALCEQLLKGQETVTPPGVTRSLRDDGLMQLTLHFGGRSVAKYVYLLEARRPYVIHCWQVHDSGGDVISQTTGIRYHEFPGGILYPVEGTGTDYQRGTSELLMQATFKVDTERTRIDPPGGIPDEVFRVTIPEGAEVIDADTGRPVSAEEKEILLAPHRLRERRIELPTSRPATQPAAGAGARG